MKQTAVEFAFEELNKWRIETFGEFALIGIPQEVLDKAKEMEKQQAIEFGYDVADYLACGVFTEGDIEDRYNEFFKSEEDENKTN